MIRIDVKVSPELHQLIAEAAEREDVGLGEFLVKLAAGHFTRPDLAKVPRKRLGRPPRQPAAAQAS